MYIYIFLYTCICIYIDANRYIYLYMYVHLYMHISSSRQKPKRAGAPAAGRERGAQFPRARPTRPLYLTSYNLRHTSTVPNPSWLILSATYGVPQGPP